VRGIPCLVILNADTGNVICNDARGFLETESFSTKNKFQETKFPYHGMLCKKEEPLLPNKKTEVPISKKANNEITNQNEASSMYIY
jgi:hypothetical protein